MTFDLDEDGPPLTTFRIAPFSSACIDQPAENHSLNIVEDYINNFCLPLLELFAALQVPCMKCSVAQTKTASVLL